MEEIQMMFKCIKEVTMNEGRVVCFQENKTYDSYHFRYPTGYEVVDDTGEPHIIGQEGNVWFDEYFVDVTEKVKNEKFHNDWVKAYKDMSNHYETEAKALQESIKKDDMKIIDELNAYFGTEANNIDEFEEDFKDEYYSHDYTESLMKFLKYLDRKKAEK